MRFYTFTNCYLSSIQQGIQTGHAAVELLVKYRNPHVATASEVAWEWARNHKTFICLNGGNFQTIGETFDQLTSIGRQLDLPTVAFFEDTMSLNGMMTTCGIVVPEYLYEMAGAVRSHSKRLVRHEGQSVLCERVDGADFELSTPISEAAADLIILLNSCGLAS